LTWIYKHGRGVRPELSVELGRAGAWSPIVRPRVRETSVGLPLDRLGPASDSDRLRLVASDGWHTVATRHRELPAGSVPQVRAIARYAGHGRFWADVSRADVHIGWQFGEREVAGAFVTVPASYTGPVTLIVSNGEFAIADERVINVARVVDGHSSIR
jgi:hypothetical protein